MFGRLCNIGSLVSTMYGCNSFSGMFKFDNTWRNWYRLVRNVQPCNSGDTSCINLFCKLTKNEHYLFIIMNNIKKENKGTSLISIINSIFRLLEKILSKGKNETLKWWCLQRRNNLQFSLLRVFITTIYGKNQTGDVYFENDRN